MGEVCLGWALSVEYEENASPGCPKKLGIGNADQSSPLSTRNWTASWLSWGCSDRTQGGALWDSPHKKGSCSLLETRMYPVGSQEVVWRQHGCPRSAGLAWVLRLTFLCGLHSVEKCQGPLAARWGLGVIALLPGQVQQGTAERHLRHGIKDLQGKLNKRVMSY